MCGISGYIGNESEPSQTLARMNAIQQHRGPDYRSFVVDKWFGLGHCRLSIIDTSAGSNQPLENERFLLSFNGEIYNWNELRIKYNLSEREYKSDTKLLFYLLSNLGVAKTCENIRGIYAFAFFDKKDRRLYLVRDRFGTKPLYIYSANNVIYFASEIKAFTTLKNWKPKLNQLAMQSYLTFQNVFSDETIFTGVKQVPPGCTLEIQFPELRIALNNNRQIQSDDVSLKLNLDTLRELEVLLEQAIKRNLVSDVEIGAYLSGGIDSSLIANFASRNIPNLKTFSVGFDLADVSDFEKNYDETEVSTAISKFLNTQHITKQINSNHISDSIDTLSYIIEDPRVGQSYPNYYAAKLASNSVKVCLSGTGGDEIFAGYPWRYHEILSENSPQRQMELLFYFWHRLESPLVMSKILKLDLNSHLAKHKSEFNMAFMSSQIITRDEVTLKSILRFEQKTFLHGLLLVEDKLSMSNGLEVRVPFLDEDLTDFAAKLPSEALLKIGNGKALELHSNDLLKQFSQLSDGKLALRYLSKKLIPIFHNLRKQGFSAPDATWFKHDKEKLIKSRIYNKSSVLWNFLDFKATTGSIDMHFSGEKNQRLLIWSLLTLESTIRQFELS